MSDELATAKTKAFADKVNTKYKAELLSTIGSNKGLRLKRFSSGILSLDLAIGSGWAFNKVNLIVGAESSGKTFQLQKAFASIQNYCRNCRLHLARCTCGDPTRCRGLFVDVEGTFDPAWGACTGMDLDLHTHARIEYAEQAVDVVDAAIRDGSFDIIALDSIAAMTSSREIEKSAEDALVGETARIMNRAFRKWVASLCIYTEQKGPAVFCINQVREKIGVMFGNPETLPGGNGQKFAPVITVRTSTSKVEDVAGESTDARVLMGGTIKKNKTFTPRLEFAFEAYLKDNEKGKKGDVDNLDALVKFGKKFGLITKEGGKSKFGAFAEANTDEELKMVLKAAPEVVQKLWWSIQSASTGFYC